MEAKQNNTEQIKTDQNGEKQYKSIVEKTNRTATIYKRQ